MKDKPGVEIVVYGELTDQVDIMTKSCHLPPLYEQSDSVVGPIWRGGIEIIGSFNGKLDGLEVFMPKNSYEKIVKVKRSLHKSIIFHMKSRRSLWPKHFHELGAAYKDIELFMFPEVSRSEIDYYGVVEQMISNDLAMTSLIGNFELIIFTSLEREHNQQQIQGKHYLWGMFMEKGYTRCSLSKGRCTNAEKGRINKSISVLDCTMKSNINPHSLSSGRIAPSVGHQPITTTQPPARCDLIPSLGKEFKRARSKKHRRSSVLSKETNDICKDVADFPGMEPMDQEKNNVMSVKSHQTLDRSGQAKICTNIEQVQVVNDHDVAPKKKKPAIITNDVDNLWEESGFTCYLRGNAVKDDLINQDLPLPDLTERVTINNETEVAEQQCSDSTMEIDEPIDSSIIFVKETMAEHRSWDGNKEIEEPIDDVVEDCVESQPQSNVCQATDAEIKAGLTPFIISKEFPVQEDSNPAIDRARASVSGEIYERIPCDTVSASKWNDAENMISRLNEDSMVDGLTEAVTLVTTEPDNQSCLVPLLQSKEGSNVHEANPPAYGETRSFLDQPECQASDLPEKASCMTPLLNFEEPGSCPSSDSTIVLELDEEDDDEETTMKGCKIFTEGSGSITSTTMLNIADDFLETSSNSFVQVGRYTIKSDLAPILTKILVKYGDIAMGCSMLSENLLEEICNAFQDLESVSFSGLRSHHLDRLRNLCQLGEALKIDMKWLNDRCEDLEKTALQISQYPFLKKEMSRCSECIESLEKKVDRNRAIVSKLLEENKSMEEEVESLAAIREKLHCEIEYVRFESRRFIGKSVVDGLF